ncbi:MAG: hypothetical protein LBP39_03135 [Rickettsiales bacterium]|jgi:hypothetical protein|nr:hypothetical protein [Rickettsiales bacterium]
MFLKNEVAIVGILLSILLASCSRDPVQKYNSAFLDRNAARIERPRKKHEKLVKQVQEESHAKNSPRKSNVETSNFMRSIKTYKDRNISIEKNSTTQVGSNLSIYYRESRLKDKTNDFDNFLSGYKSNDQIYLENNYTDYSEEKISFRDIKPTAKGLYGELKLRKEEERAIPDNLDFLKCFDYIDLMNRTKKEIYLRSKETKNATNLDDDKNSSKILKSVTTTKEKLLKMFKDGNKAAATEIKK